MQSKEALFGKTYQEIKEIVNELGLPAFNASQICDWLYKKTIREIDEMSNLSKKTREILNSKYVLGLVDYHKVQSSIDGTKKYLFPTHKGHFIETAMIPDDPRHTVCVSTQMGCKMNCLFCATGKQGWQGNLTAGEILNQFRNIPEFEQMSNIVYMGMGEPLDNVDAVLKSLEILTSDWGYAWSPKRITVSSVGVIPAMKRFLNESDAHLAISLHSPFEEERQKLMPVQKAYPLKQVLDEIRAYTFNRQRRVSFEYIVFEGLNDTMQHADELVRILNGIRCRVNLIRFHAIPDVDLKTTNEQRLLDFQNRLKDKGITTTIRASRGQDIYAACGLLSTKALNKAQ
ncbi:MAG: 23S rRNA (adenine(2503)-C(2))-methyltransferase RlmN [Bacteroidales bacterium]|nr:23S rRNA (adenine(2503)-C(2))-methyltransferase RlmN [Bacteroidales bacterium]